ncbi:MAG: hydrogenase maturation nickel metallochaperone HypA [Planctomycetales bacterium]|nr:hydrogenase maturation nickel metallochaperone HypA [Planctomycetales bacterium]
MHELSIATRVVEIAAEAARDANATKVTAITLRIGVLSAVQEGALQWAFRVAAEGSLLEGAVLRVVQVPLTIFCSVCGETVEPVSVQELACPCCGALSGDVRTGQEMEVDTLTIVDDTDEA